MNLAHRDHALHDIHDKKQVVVLVILLVLHGENLYGMIHDVKKKLHQSVQQMRLSLVLLELVLLGIHEMKRVHVLVILQVLHGEIMYGMTHLV